MLNIPNPYTDPSLDPFTQKKNYKKDLGKSSNRVTGSNSIFELTLSKPHSFFIMTTRTITGRFTRNSRNAGSVPGIAFGRTIPPRVSTPRRLPFVPLSESRFEELGSEHGDGNHGDEDEEQGGDCQRLAEYRNP